MCRPSCRPAPGCSPPGRAARPTPPTRTRSRWPPPGCPACARWSMTSSWRCCGSWPTAAGRWAKTTPGWSPSCISCCSSSSPAGRRRSLSAAQAKALLARVRPRDAAGKARRRVAAELISDLERIYQRKKAANKELNALLAGHRHHPDGPARDRPVRRCPAAGRGRRRDPVPRPGRTSPPGTAPRRSTPPPATRSATGCRGPGTGRSTGCCTSWPSSSSATPPRAAPTTTAKSPPGRHPGKRCAP